MTQVDDSKKPSGTLTPGADLIPDLPTAQESRVYRYWVGVLPACPVDTVHMAGLAFSKITENVIPDPLRSGKAVRQPVPGAIVFIDEHKKDLLRERIRKTVVRFTEAKGQKQERGTGENVGDVHVQPRRGHVLTIPTRKEIEQARKDGRAANPYIAQADDTPIARFVFIELCADQENGQPGTVYPDTVDKTGIFWPDDLELLA